MNALVYVDDSGAHFTAADVRALEIEDRMRLAVEARPRAPVPAVINAIGWLGPARSSVPALAAYVGLEVSEVLRIVCDLEREGRIVRSARAGDGAPLFWFAPKGGAR